MDDNRPTSAPDVAQRLAELVRTMRAAEQEWQALTGQQLDTAGLRTPQLFRDLLDVLGPSIFVGLLTPQGIVIEANRPALAAAGVNPEDILGRACADIDAWAYSGEVQEQLRQAITRAAGGEGSRYDVQVRAAGDRLIDVDFSLQPLRDETGAVVFLVPSASVITERKQTEEELHQSQALLHMAGRLSRVGAWSVDLPGFEHTWSDEVYAIHDMSPGTAVNVADAIDYYAPECRSAISQAFAACVRDGTAYDVELQIITAKGRRVWVHSIGEAIRDADGHVSRVQGACQDISERKAAEAETRDLGERLTATLESLADGFFTLDRDWRFTYVNGEAERMFAVPRATLLGSDIWAIFPEARGSVFEHEYQRALRDNAAVQFETFYPPLAAWFDVRAFPSPQGLAVHFRDITAVRLAGEALRTSEERFRLLAKATNDAIWDWDLATDAVWWNDGFETLFGYRREDVDPTVKSWTDCIHPQDLGRVTAGIHHVIEHGGEIWTDEYRFRSHDGVYAYVLDRGHIIRDAEGRATRMIGGMTDLTNRKLAAEALRTSLEEFRALAEAMPQIVWITRPDGWTVYLNQRWMDYTGLTLEEGLGHGWNTPFHPDDLQRALKAWRHAAATIGTFSLESRLRRADGVYRWWLMRSVPLRDAIGNVLKWFGTCTDIHDLKLAELEISRANRALQAEIVERKRAEQAAETANRSKSEFLANMSHEIRTPLNGIVGMTELALDTALSAEQREYLDLVKSSGESLLTVINDILDFSKIEADDLPSIPSRST